ncbi:AMP-binding enzyme [Enhydrobacter aerosaccus]|uniref:AMP-binding enzyme n=1 Tax=Enhydrobacter aerosaccus TaxID=225324 RepID=A0A1T4KTU9_9HYPH|nr:AMP-binding protein [Enhydrobacter aerosaccus]SJZ45869.1 AMP-binding enzyme [Enhydrobacter aerosaccus]
MDALTQGLRRAFELKPDAQSTSFAPRRRTWRQTIDRVGRVAGALETLDVGHGDRVAILAQNTDRYLELMYAVAWVGAALVPINTGIDASRIEHILADSRAVVLFIDGTMAHHLTDLEGRMHEVREAIWIDDIASPEGMLHYEDMTAYEPVPDRGAGGTDLAGLFYDGTAGTALTHTEMLANADRAMTVNGFDGSTVYLHASPMFELAEDALSFAVTLAGGRHVFVPRFEPREVLQIVAIDKVTHAQLLPDMIDQLLSHPRFGEFGLSSLKAILHGARPVPAVLLQKVHEKLPCIRLIDGDGQPTS